MPSAPRPRCSYRRCVAVIGLDHVQVACPAGGESAAAAFYRDLLGLTPVPKPEPLASRGGCWFAGNGFQLHVGVDADFRPAQKAHPALLVANLDSLAAALTAAGHEVRWSDELPGTSRCYVDDPFGNRIELIGA
jgi:catechol 2,3-dioxygenase-like lactoylglutathione lyase family enzyme